MNNPDLERIFKKVLDCCFEVHKELGPGLLEGIYCEALCLELEDKGLRYEKEKSIQVSYKGRELPMLYRIDILVENMIIVEAKAIRELEYIHTAQILTYMKLLDKPLGLLVNFNKPLLKDGIKRVILNYHNKDNEKS